MPFAIHTTCLSALAVFGILFPTCNTSLLWLGVYLRDPALRERLTREGAVLMEPLRQTPFKRFFFREPINGYVFEVIDQARARNLDR